MLYLYAAFDTVDRDRLLFELENAFIISGKVLQWLRSFLMNRTSSVGLNGVHNSSPKLPVMYGVPQGSILGPLLFIFYVNALNYLGYEFDLTVHSYADDTTLCIGFDPLSEFEDVYKRLNCCLQKVQHWMTFKFSYTKY